MQGAKEQRAQLPLTIKQLQSAKKGEADDVVTIDGRQVHQVAIVGVIAAIDSQATFVSLIIDDSTGQISINFWTDGGEDAYFARKRATWVEGSYVRAIGKLKMNEGQPPMLMGFDIKLITDFNEVTAHMLNSVYCHLHALKGPVGATPVAGTASAAAPAFGGATAGGVGGFGGAVAGFSEGGKAEGSDLDRVQSAVMDVFRQAVGTEEGMDVRAVAGQLAAKGFSNEDVHKAVEFLSTEGHLYSTIDEFHYQSTM